MAFKKNQIPEELMQNFQENLGVFFVGAGLSVAAGFPTWDGLLSGLIKHATKHKRISSEKAREYKRLLKDSSKFLFLAEELRVDLGSLFTSYMEDEFINSDRKWTPNHELLAKINASLIMTINYDDLIERAYNKIRGEYPNSFMYNQSREAANNFWRNRFFILKAHGDAKRDVQSIILSQKDYRKTLYRENGYRSLLQSIFTTKSIVFLGVSLTDPEFNQLLDYLHDSYHGGGPTHYLLIEDKKNMQSLSRRYLDDFRVQTIEYKNPTGNHEEITQFLTIMARDVPYKPK